MRKREHEEKRTWEKESIGKREHEEKRTWGKKENRNKTDKRIKEHEIKRTKKIDHEREHWKREIVRAKENLRK